MNTELDNDKRHGTALPRTLGHGLLWVALIALLECTLFNLPFWTTFSASTDTASASTPIGRGLSHASDGSLQVTDPAQAYLDVDTDSSSRFLRIDPAEAGKKTASIKSGHTASADHEIQGSFHVRADVDGHAGRTVSVSTAAPRSLYVRTREGGHVRLWISEAQGTHVDCSAVRANVRVPFHFDWLRVAVMAAIALLIEAWRPSSRLWSLKLDTHSHRQRICLTCGAGIVGILTLAVIIRTILHASPLNFAERGNYVYDFDQYGHIADSLLHGHTNLDLPVPRALGNGSNPYDPATRERLLSQGTTPIYWDYALYNGHWYSYFGVLPALVLFAPFRLVSSLVVPGGTMLPANAAVIFLVFLFALFGSLLTIRLTERIAPHASLASVSLAMATLLLGSNAGYLVMRGNFYSVPFAASLALSAAGLWFWLGSTMPRADGNVHNHAIAMGGAPPVSWPHLCAGSLCIAANFGCRPTFTLVALLGFPIFLPQIKAACSSLARRLREDDTGGDGAARRDVDDMTAGHREQIPPSIAPTAVPVKTSHAVIATISAVLIPALIVVLPLAAYNVARFGSPFDFGDRYQITVADMVHTHNATSNLLPTLGYYLFLPLRFSNAFPFLAVNPTPLPHWSYTEAMVGGLFPLCPVLLFALMMPLVHRRLHRSGCLPTLTCALALAMLLMVVDGMRGGLGWRYMSDFGWLVALACTAPIMAVLHETDTPVCPDTASRHIGGNGLIGTRSASLRHLRISAARTVVVVLVLASLAITAVSWFTPGRDDALIRTDPALFHEVQSWFSLL